MTITYEPNQETLDVLQSVVDEINSSRRIDDNGKPIGEELTIESYLTRSVEAIGITATKNAYNAAVRRLGEGAAKLPYTQRKALIEQVESSLK